MYSGGGGGARSPLESPPSASLSNGEVGVGTGVGAAGGAAGRDAAGGGAGAMGGAATRAIAAGGAACDGSAPAVATDDERGGVGASAGGIGGRA